MGSAVAKELSNAVTVNDVGALKAILAREDVKPELLRKKEWQYEDAPLQVAAYLLIFNIFLSFRAPMTTTHRRHQHVDPLHR
jgi:hypothetical protein